MEQEILEPKAPGGKRVAPPEHKGEIKDLTVKNLAKSDKPYTYWDTKQVGFGVRVSPQGRKTFLACRRHGKTGKLVECAIGTYPDMTLGDARKEAKTVLDMIEGGETPKERKEREQREEAMRRRETFSAAVEAFFRDGSLGDLRTGTETERVIRREFLGQIPKREKRPVERDGKRVEPWITQWQAGPDPRWSKTPVAEITRRNIIERLDEIKRRGGKHAARHALGAVRKFFNWCADGERFGVEVSPCLNIRDRTLGFSKDGRELKRRRVLTDAELYDVWAAADALTQEHRDKVLKRQADADMSRLHDPITPLVKLLMLTGQRLNDVAQAKWTEIDLDKAVLTVPPERYKTGLAQEVPLSARALDILKELPRFERGYALTTTGGARPISGFGKMKSRLDEEIAKRRTKDGREPMPPWILHDLRRTVRTRLVSDLSVEAFIAERVIGHALPGLHGVYDQGSHRIQKRDALDRWSMALALIVGLTAPADNVADLAAARAERAASA